MEIQKYYLNIFGKNVHFGQMDISRVALEMFLRKQLKIYTKSRIRLTSTTLKGSGFTPRFIKFNFEVYKRI